MNPSPPQPVFDLGLALSPIVRRCQIPGLAAAVVQGDQISACGAAGVRRRGSSRPLGAADRFHLGSCTKAMTATLVGHAIDTGQFTWNSSIADLLGPFVPGLRPEWRGVAVHHLLAHRSGLPANPGRWSLAPARARVLFRRSPGSLAQQRLAIVRHAFSRPPQTAPGAAYEYSNTGYIAIGAALEQIAGQSWETLIAELLWRPLGITTGGFGAPGAYGELGEPWGHAPQGRPISPKTVAADWQIPPVYGPAGTAHMNLADWARFVALHLRGHAANPQRCVQLLRPETFALLHTPVDGEAYAGGWEFALRPWARGSRPSDRGLMLHHDGSNGQWYAVTRFAPELNLAFLVAANQNGAAGLEACERALKVLGDLASLAR